MNSWRRHKARTQHEDKHSMERVWHTASREPSDTPPESHFFSFAPNGIASTTPYSQGFRLVSLGQTNQRASTTAHVFYGYPRYNLKLVQLFRFDLPLPGSGSIFLFPHTLGHKPTVIFAHCTVPNPRVKRGGAPVMPNTRRFSATQSVRYFFFFPGLRFPTLSISPDTTVLGTLCPPMRNSVSDHNNFLVCTVVTMLSHSVDWMASF